MLGGLRDELIWGEYSLAGDVCCFRVRSWFFQLWLWLLVVVKDAELERALIVQWISFTTWS